MALTFDDGPHPIQTERIVDTLRAYDVPATFFVLGDMVSDPDGWTILEELRDDPLFTIANHSWSHADLTLLSWDAALEEVDATSALLETFEVDVDFFRFPYGMSDCGTRDMVALDLGLLVTGWHVDTVDWCYAATGATGSCLQSDYWRIPREYEHDMLGFVEEQVARFDGGVILMHDIHAYTADHLSALIEMLLSQGYTIVPLSDLHAFPRLNAGDPVDLPYLGEPCDVLADACWQVEYFAWCEPLGPADTRGVCVMPCEGYCIDRDGAAMTFCMAVAPGAGQCVARADDENGWCDAVPGTTATWADRWVGASGASDSTQEVCVPTEWPL